MTECECNADYTDETENAKHIQESVFATEFFVHILCVQHNASRREYAPYPEPDLSAAAFTKQGKCAEFGCGIISPAEGENKSVNKCTAECADAEGLYEFVFSFHL